MRIFFNLARDSKQKSKLSISLQCFKNGFQDCLQLSCWITEESEKENFSKIKSWHSNNHFLQECKT